ncbi:MAG: phospholipase D-like domain-containing protein [Bacteroidota bacterium]|jgi:hypothetical protein
MVKDSSYAFARYGLTEACELGINSGRSYREPNTYQDVDFHDLTPGTVYCIQPFSVRGNDTCYTRRVYACTTSLNSTGEVNVFFNQAVDNVLRYFSPANGSVRLDLTLIRRIEEARHSIDFCYRDMNGSVGEAIVDKLIAAQLRGVRVRAIFEADNAVHAAIERLRNHVPCIFDTFDRINAGWGLMNNAYTIIDARNRASDTDDWVLTGSWNPTDTSTLIAAENLIEIQDQAVAVMFTRAFEEMWGGSTEIPDSSASRFGSRKRDTNPQGQIYLEPESIWLELFFGPGTSIFDRIIEYTNSCSSTYFASRSFTNYDIAEALLQRGAVLPVRGVVDNAAVPGSVFPLLRIGGLDVASNSPENRRLNENFVLFDPEYYGRGVITGTQDWSLDAARSDDAVSIFIHDNRITKEFAQEWYTRYREAGGTGGLIIVGIDELSDLPRGFDLSIFPHPVRQGTQAAAVLEHSSDEVHHIMIFDALGRLLLDSVSDATGDNHHPIQLPTSSLRPGIHTLILSDGDGALQSRRFLVTP